MFNQGVIVFGGGGGAGGVTDINGATGSVTFAGVSGIFIDRQGSTVYVGHSGAYTDVDYIDFNLTANPTHNEGRIHWNDYDKTLDIDTELSNTRIQVGQEMVIRVTNKTGTTIENGTLVYINGAQGNRPTVEKAIAESVATNNEATIGWVTSDIANNATGYVTTFGLVRDIPTSGYPVGSQLYLSAATSGFYTDVAPVAPDHTVTIGWVVVENATEGVIMAHIDNGFQTYQLHDVDETAPTTSGTALIWNGNKYVVGGLNDLQGGFKNIVTATSEYTALRDDNLILASGNITVLMPDAASVSGIERTVKNIGNGIIRVSGITGNYFDGGQIASIEALHEAVTFVSDGKDYWII